MKIIKFVHLLRLEAFSVDEEEKKSCLPSKRFWRKFKNSSWNLKPFRLVSNARDPSPAHSELCRYRLSRCCFWRLESLSQIVSILSMFWRESFSRLEFGFPGREKASFCCCCCSWCCCCWCWFCALDLSSIPWKWKKYIFYCLMQDYFGNSYYPV